MLDPDSMPLRMHALLPDFLQYNTGLQLILIIKDWSRISPICACGASGQDPEFLNRGGAMSHTHMWAWLRFCIATYHCFSHCHYYCAA